MTAGPARTSSADVHDRFCGRSREADSRHRQWRSQQVGEVVDLVEGHVTTHLYRLSERDVLDASAATEHALGEVDRAEAESVALIADWTTSYAFTHLMHYMLESQGAIPTFQDFRDFCRRDPRARAGLWEPASAAIDQAAELYGRRRARAAMRWRVGNAYYSFLRETYVVVVLREAGLPVQFHPLADALFRVDAWAENANLNLFVGNARYKSGDRQGRKPRSQALLADAEPAFATVDVELPVTHVFGRVHLPVKERLERLAAELHAGAGP